MRGWTRGTLWVRDSSQSPGEAEFSERGSEALTWELEWSLKQRLLATGDGALMCWGCRSLERRATHHTFGVTNPVLRFQNEFGQSWVTTDLRLYPHGKVALASGCFRQWKRRRAHRGGRAAQHTLASGGGGHACHGARKWHRQNNQHCLRFVPTPTSPTNALPCIGYQLLQPLTSQSWV